MRGRFLSRIGVRLLLFNVLLVFLPVAGLFSLRSLERQLLDAQERAMVQQGRLVAAALGGGDAAIDETRVTQLLRQLGRRSEARLRIVDRDARVLGDSAVSEEAPAPAPKAGSPPDTPYEPPAVPAAARGRFLYRVGAALWKPVRFVRALFDRPSYDGPAPVFDPLPRDEIDRAFQGRYGAALRESPGQRSLTLYSVIPVRTAGGDVCGAVVVSRSTSRILAALWTVRLDVFRVFVVSVLAAAALSLLVSATIARPLVRLRDEAGGLLDPRGRLRRSFRGSRRRDEIGDLTRALQQLTSRAERHLAFVESFSSDVAHEFRNPLAAIRSATEMLAEADDPAERRQLLATVEREVARLDRLLGGVREISRIDAGLETEPLVPVDLGALLGQLVPAGAPPRANGVTVSLDAPPGPLPVLAAPERLVQAFENLLANAVSFSPPGATVAVIARQEGATVVVDVDDSGPGIPPEHRERVFDRFFTSRPPGGDEPHDGLGLAIVRALVEGYGGSVAASDRPGGGARLTVKLPVAKV
ncbi:MAG: HAMP domain-containing histidine kinase [Holophagales bacterium]|nr:HAMP domain-containing histidine kinase [Holophagales bacterium]